LCDPWRRAQNCKLEIPSKRLRRGVEMINWLMLGKIVTRCVIFARPEKGQMRAERFPR